MALPTSPTTLTPEQLDDLNKKLSHLRHEINNHLSLLVAALELARFRPEMAERMMQRVSEQPGRIRDEVERFSQEFEQALGLARFHRGDTDPGL